MEPRSYFARWLHAFRLSGESERAFARRLGIEQQTLRRIYEGHAVHQKTYQAIAAALRLPPGEVFKHSSDMIGDDFLEDSRVLVHLIDVVSRLPEEDQAVLLSEAIKLAKKYSGRGV